MEAEFGTWRRELSVNDRRAFKTGLQRMYGASGPSVPAALQHQLARLWPETAELWRFLSHKHLEPAPATARQRYEARLLSVGNPDMRQHAPISDPIFVYAYTLGEIAAYARGYIRAFELGLGNLPRIPVRATNLDERRETWIAGVITYDGDVFSPSAGQVIAKAPASDDIEDGVELQPTARYSAEMTGGLSFEGEFSCWTAFNEAFDRRLIERAAEDAQIFVGLAPDIAIALVRARLDLTTVSGNLEGFCVADVSGRVINIESFGADNAKANAYALDLIKRDGVGEVAVTNAVVRVWDPFANWRIDVAEEVDGVSIQAVLREECQTEISSERAEGIAAQCNRELLALKREAPALREGRRRPKPRGPRV